MIDFRIIFDTEYFGGIEKFEPGTGSSLRWKAHAEALSGKV